MPRYLEVVGAAGETATKILAMRAKGGTKIPSVRVTTYGGRTASVDWSPYGVTLNMPSLPPDSVLTRGEADRLVAFIGHECCHVLHSDRGVWAQAVAAGARVRDWTNALEDVRIEAKEIGIGKFPALRGLLESMTGRLHYESVVEAGKTGRIIGAEVSDAPYAACVLGRVANGYDIPSASGLAGGLSDEVRSLVDRALAGIGKCRSTDDVLTLARSLVDAEARLGGNEPGQSDKGSDGSEGSQDGDKGSDGSEGSQDGDKGSDGSEGSEGSQDGDKGSDGSEGSEGSQDGNKGSGGSQDGDKGSDGSEGSQDGDKGSASQPGNGSGPATDANITGMIDAIAARAGIGDLDEHALTDNSHRLSAAVTRVVDGPRINPDENGSAANNLARRLPANAVLAGQIGRLLVSDEVRRVTHHESSGRLDRRALVRLQVGATDVYSRRDNTPGIDTALLVLIDGSASMRIGTGSLDQGPTRMNIAQTAAYHIARAAELANAKVAVGVFYSLGEQGVTGAKVVIVKPWHLPLASCAAALAGILANAQTPLSPAILAGGRLLADVTATRRILMCLTDGECDYGAAGMTKACAIVADDRVEVVGVGMACASVAAAFPPRYSVNVENLDQLATTGLGVLCTMLEDANPRGAD